jgi:carboxylesterase
MNKLLKLIMKRRGVIAFILIFLFVATLSKTVNELGVNYMANQLERKDGIIVGAEPFYIQKNNDVGVLLIHGFTSSPNDFRDLGNFLSEKNITVFAPLLPGHGTHPRDLKNIQHEDWLNFVQQSLDSLNTKKKFVLGYSMGGTLALHLASQNDLNGIMAINAAIFLANEYIPFIPLVRIVETYSSTEPAKIIQFLNEERVFYDSYPLDSVMELQELINVLDIHSITEPTLISQSDNDETVLPESANYIFNNINSQDKEIFILSNSTHANIQYQQVAFDKVYDFIQQHS